jgi:hypothetical protein
LKPSFKKLAIAEKDAQKKFNTLAIARLSVFALMLAVHGLALE